MIGFVLAWRSGIFSAPPPVTPSPSFTSVIVTPIPPTRTLPQQQLLSIPALNLNRPIVLVPIDDGRWDIDGLGLDVGRLAGTAHIGDGGNVVIVGHVTLPDNKEGPFIDLATLSPGSQVVIQKGNHRYFYEVESLQVVAPDDLSVVAPTDYVMLTLMTCTGWDVPSQRYTERLVVRARLVKKE